MRPAVSVPKVALLTPTNPSELSHWPARLESPFAVWLFVGLRLLSARDLGPLSGNSVNGLKFISAAPIRSQSPPIGSSIFTPRVEALNASGDQDQRPAPLIFWIV